MIGIVLFLHIVATILLGIIILMQSGRGGGLTESFAAVDNMFGAQTNTMLTKGTTVLATIFLITSVSLAVLSAKRDESLMSASMVDTTAEVAQSIDDLIKSEAEVIDLNVSKKEAVPAVDAPKAEDPSAVAPSTEVPVATQPQQ